MYFYILILCLNTMTSMINTNTFFDFTDFQGPTHLGGRAAINRGRDVQFFGQGPKGGFKNCGRFALHCGGEFTSR